MANEDLLLYVRRASRRQVATGIGVGALLLTAFLVTLPFAGIALPHYNGFIPALDTALLFCDGVTATILLSQGTILRSRALIVLGCGYLFSGIVVIPHALSFPEAFAPDGLFGGEHAAARLHFVWHFGLPVAAIAYALLNRAPDERSAARGSLRRFLLVSLAGTVAAAALMTLPVLAELAALPALMSGDEINWSERQVFWLCVFMTALIAAAIVAVGRGQRSLLDVWLMVALWAWLLEVLLLLATSSRFTLGWYSGRVIGMLAGAFVLVALLVETSRLYMQAALSAISDEQQREGRLMSLDAAASAIAHEVKQPITAMVTNASAALIRVEKDPPDLPKVINALRLIIADGHRAADTIAEVRALFGNREPTEVPVDLNQLVRETLDLRAVELASRGILTTHDLAADLPDLPVRPQQMRQVLVNLLNNAIEALDERPAGPRRIVVTSAPTERGGVVIDIGDSGRGIAAGQTERIFDAFFTTKTYGTGMGLPLCRSIVEGHGGKLSVTSVEGKGTTFHILLPGPQA